MGETDAWTVLTIVGLTVVTVLTRGFFFLSERPWQLPGWAQRGLQYAPIAALAAVIAPDLVQPGGVFGGPGTSARLCGALAAALFYFAARRSSLALVGAIAAGMAVYLPLHLLLNW